MILLELPSLYINSWEFVAFKYGDSVDFQNQIARISVHLLEPINNKIPFQILMNVEMKGKNANLLDIKEDLKRLVLKEIIIPSKIGDFTIVVAEEL